MDYLNQNSGEEARLVSRSNKKLYTLIALYAVIIVMGIGAVITYQSGQKLAETEVVTDSQVSEEAVSEVSEIDVQTVEAIAALAQQVADAQGAEADSRTATEVSETEAKVPVPQTVTPSLIRIVSPNGGESIKTGMSSIVWEADVSLTGCSYTTYLKRDDGTRAVEYSNKIFNHNSTEIIKNDSVFSSAGLLGEYRAHMDVTCDDGGTHTDYSDSWFSFGTDVLVAGDDTGVINKESIVRVISPNSSEDYVSDKDSIEVSWLVGNDVAFCSPTVRLIGGVHSRVLKEISKISIAEGGSHKKISGVYDVPGSLYGDGTYFRMQIDIQCAGDTTIFRDNSDDAFQLVRKTS